MLILVEGPDCSGKSTLVERLTEHIRTHALPGQYLKTFHSRPPTLHPLLEYVEPLLGYRPGQGYEVVADRWHWGEAVYPDLFHRPTKMDAGVWRYTEMFLRSRGALVVYMEPDARGLKMCLESRGDDMVRKEDLEQVRTGFAAVAARSLVSQYRIRISGSFKQDDTTGAHVRAIVNLARDLERRAAILNTLHTYVGPPRPAFLLVGDERPAKMDREYPAFMPFAPNSGHFLLNALRGPRLPNIGLINANDVDDISKAYGVLDYPRVATLGRLADRRVGPAIQHGKVPHPQFVRRFYRRHQDEYGLVLEDAMLGGDLGGWRPNNPSWRPR